LEEQDDTLIIRDAGAARDVRDEVIARYLSTSAGIHRRADRADREAFARAYRWYLERWLPSDTSLPWVDLGCGQGQLMSLAHEAGFSAVVGVDMSSEMLAGCRELSLDVVQEDAAEFIRRSEPESFGVVSAFDFLEHLPRNAALMLLRDVRRTLKPGGVVLIKVPNGASPNVGDIFFSDLTHESMWTPASITQLATLAGFSRIDIREVGPVPHGVVSSVRYALWKCVRMWRRLSNTIETGSPGPSILTRVMLVRLA
jgi:2-polyprenyl-3-methyl-5-hydroxy-6-metoxy-1,4-benzoquinol methylase